MEGSARPAAYLGTVKRKEHEEWLERDEWMTDHLKFDPSYWPFWPALLLWRMGFSLPAVLCKESLIFVCSAVDAFRDYSCLGSG
jgi:hypothetical protein